MAEYLVTTEDGQQHRVVTEDSPKAGFAENLRTSAGKFLGDVANTVMHPVDTAKGALSLAAGTVENMSGVGLGGGKQKLFSPFANAAGKHLKDRYGSIDAIKNTAYTDPVGMAADVSTVAGVAGGALRLPFVSRLPGAAAVGKGLTATAEFTDPLMAATKVPMALGGSHVAGKLAERAYASALKPSKKRTLEQAEKVIDTGLREGIAVNPKGLEHVSDRITDLNDQIADKITTANNAGATVDPGMVATRTSSAKNTFRNQVAPEGDLAAIQSVEDEFLRNNPNPIPVADAQKLKQGTYKQLKDKAYTGELKGASVEAQKALARGLKEEIAALVPEISDLNARETALLGLDKEINSALQRIERWDLIRFPAMVAGAAGGGATSTGTGAIIAALAKQVIDNPTFKSKLGIALYNAANRKTPTSMTGRAAAIGRRMIVPMAVARNYSGADAQQ